MILILKVGIPLYLVLGSIVAGRMARTLHPPLDDDETCAMIAAGIFWPLVLVGVVMVTIGRAAMKYERPSKALPEAKVVQRS